MQDQEEAGNQDTTNTSDHWVTHPTTPSGALTSKTLVEDVTLEEYVARQPATLEEETTKEPSPHNNLEESYVAEVQRIGKHIPSVSTDVEEHEHITNHFNKKLNEKVFDTFTGLFSNRNIDSIQET